jgi:hypothetical protein
LIPDGKDCARVEDLERADEFFGKFRAKLGMTPFNLLNSPYSKKQLFNVDVKTYAFQLEIAWFRFYWLGLVLMFSFWILELGFGWFIIPGVMTLMGVFWCPWLYLFLFKRGLRKAGFRGRVRKLCAEAFFERIWSDGSD